MQVTHVSRLLSSSSSSLVRGGSLAWIRDGRHVAFGGLGMCFAKWYLVSAFFSHALATSPMREELKDSA